jgi:hypothetical protein
VKRVLIAVMSATLVLALLPGAVAADRVIKFEDHHVGFFCEGPFDGGFAIANIDSSEAFGDFAGAEIWLDPAIPFEEAATLAGQTDTAEIVVGPTQVELSATFLVFDADGVGQQAVLQGVMTPLDDPQPIEQPGFGNHHSKTEGTIQFFEGTAALTLSDRTIELSQCFGEVSDVSVFETNPRSFVSSNSGVFLDCFWETGDAVAALFVTQDDFGFFADTFLSTGDLQLFGIGEASGSVTVQALAATIQLIDATTNEPHSAAAEASFEPDGSPVTSIRSGMKFRIKIVEQALTANGRLDFSTGQSFDIDPTNCSAVAFSNHAITTQPAGPKPRGPVPVNDTPEGAISASPGDRFNVATGGAAFEPEEPTVTCPEGDFDRMGHTLWYTIDGTDGPVTIDTAGSGFDTLLAVYVPEGENLVEVACIDDVFRDPIGATYQAALTFDTVEGVTYFVQVGGYNDLFSGTTEFGRLRLAIT